MQLLSVGGITNCEGEEARSVDKVLLQEIVVWDANRILTVIRTRLNRHFTVKQ